MFRVIVCEQRPQHGGHKWRDNYKQRRNNAPKLANNPNGDPLVVPGGHFGATH